MTQSMSSPFMRPVMLRHLKTMVLIALVAAIAVIPHAYNMFEYPYYENDEGTYMAQAWSLFTTGELAPYTYWYDHAPGGWIQIGLWTELTQGFDTFGFSINSGRVLMLVFHVLSSVLLLGIGWKLFHNELPGLIAMLIFSFSPLGIYFQRRVLLDNIMTFWMLLSLYLIMGKKRTLVHYIGSAVAFSIAFLSKESIIYLLPAMLIIVFANVRNYRNKFPLFLWVVLMGLLIAYYPLYAILKGELFPTGTLLGGTSEHVSLLETLAYQNGREGGSFLDYGSAFMINLRGWMGDFGLYADPALIITGIGATFITAILAIRTAQLRPIVLLTLCYWAFLIRGGVVIEFYIVPLIPLLALCTASIIVLGLRLIYRSLPQPVLRVTSSAVLLSAVALPFVAVYQSKGAIYTSNPTSGQIAAVNYIQENIASDAFVAIDMYAYIELSNLIPASHYYWKVDKDPEITDDLLTANWCNIDYMLTTPQLAYDAVRAPLDITRAAYENSSVLASYSGSGWDVEVRQVNKTNCPIDLVRLEAIENVAEGTTQ